MKSWDRTRREIPCRAERDDSWHSYWQKAFVALQDGVVLCYLFLLRLWWKWIWWTQTFPCHHIFFVHVYYLCTLHTVCMLKIVYHFMIWVFSIIFCFMVPFQEKAFQSGDVGSSKFYIIWTIIMSSSSSSSARNTITIKEEKWRK